MEKRIQIITALFTIFVISVVVIANMGLISVALPFFKYIPYGDKLGHFCLMGTLSLLINLSLNSSSYKLKNFKILKGSFFLSIFIILEELSQIFIESRSFSLSDLFFDFLGIILIGNLALKINQPKVIKTNS